MTATFVLPHAGAVDALRIRLARARVLYEPRGGGRGAEWRQATGREPFEWDAAPALTGVKRFFFPAREALVRWQGATAEDVPIDPAPFALFGLRPCDAAALAYTDRFFAGDRAYEARRRRALLVAVNCLAACAGGFCVETDAGPFARGAVDLVLTRLPDGRVLVDVGSAAGHAALQADRGTLRPLDASARAAAATSEALARASFAPRPFVARALARVNAAPGAAAVAPEEWDALGRSCLACTGCTSVCPTCTCFTVVDEGEARAGVRVRAWDSCLLEGFQREASGHHPAPEPGDRVRRFWYHKLSHEHDAVGGRLGCVGCGRCDVTCLGAIGATRVLGVLGEAGRP